LVKRPGYKFEQLDNKLCLSLALWRLGRSNVTILSNMNRRNSGSLRGEPGDLAADLERDFELLMVGGSLFWKSVVPSVVSL
jgi:hypothetical protein